MPTPFDHLSHSERQRLRAEAPALAEEVARSTRFKPGAPAVAPARRVTDPVALGVIAGAYRRLLSDQSEALVVVRLTQAEALAFPGERHPREWCSTYALAMAGCVLAGVAPPTCVPVLGISLDGDIAMLWSYFVGSPIPPDADITQAARARLAASLDLLAATPVERFLASRDPRTGRAGEKGK